jgi:hypothetical protein
MPWNPNNASRQYTQRAQQQAQRSHRHNQQYAAQQMNALIAQDRALRYRRQQKRIRQQQDGVVEQSGERVPGSGAQPSAAFGSAETQRAVSYGRPNAVRISYVLIRVIAAVILAFALTLGYRAVAANGRAVAGSVLIGSNVREGPGTTFAVVAVLQAGSHVTVACVEEHWARLASPNADRYVARRLLTLERNPKPC